MDLIYILKVTSIVMPNKIYLWHNFGHFLSLNLEILTQSKDAVSFTKNCI